MLGRSETRWMQLAIGIVLSLMGLVWALQGVGLLGGSTMSGQLRWLVIGLAVLVMGLALALRSIRR
jgi:hypothetical protein